MRSHHSHRRAGISTVAIVVIIVAVGLVGMCMVGVCAGIVFFRIQKTRTDAKRVDCINNLRLLGAALDKQESVGGVYPSEVQWPQGTVASFYTLIRAEVEQDQPPDLGNPKNIKAFLCPTRRTTEQAPGKRDYGYVTFGPPGPKQAVGPHGPKQAVLDFPGGTNKAIISNTNGMANTAVLSHLWMNPANYGGGDPTDGAWDAAPPQNARAQAQPYEDSDTSGSTVAMGSPHPNTMPVLFADGHVTSLSYTTFGAPNWQNIWNTFNMSPILFPNP